MAFFYEFGIMVSKSFFCYEKNPFPPGPLTAMLLWNHLLRIGFEGLKSDQFIYCGRKNRLWEVL